MSVRNPFRHKPPRPDPAWIERPRLAERLARRFELRVLLVVAPAGHGKTAALAQALDRHRVRAGDHDDGGRAETVDLWLQCEPADAEAEHLAAGILASAGFDLPVTESSAASTVADALLQRAPRQVSLVLDDVHRIPHESAGARLLDELIDALPRNAHLVLSGRAHPAIRTTRLRLDGGLELLSVGDLLYDDDELERLAVSGQAGEHPSPVVDDLVRWPALATLRRERRDPRVADPTVDYLLEEVASSFTPERPAAITALSLLDHVDDQIAAAAGAGPSASEALADLPLVHRRGDDAFQLHHLWRRALVGSSEAVSAPVRAAMSRIAEHALAAGDEVLAAERFALARDGDGVRRAARALAARPLTGLAVADLNRVRALCQETLGDDTVTNLLDASIAATGDERTSIARFESIARSARRHGEDSLEALALQNVMNACAILDPTDHPDWVLERAEVLAASGDHLAQLTVACIRADRSRFAADPDAAMAALRSLDGNRSPLATMMRSFGYGDLGRPEEVRGPEEDPSTDVASRGGGQYLAQALWLRGELAPEEALTLGTGLAEEADASRFVHVRVPTNAVLALVAAAAGEVTVAGEFAGRARLAADRTSSRHVRAFAGLATAAVALCERDEVAAAEELAEMLADEPIVRWPPRPYLYALPLVYALAPSTRSTLDACGFGPALTVAQRAGRALVALRERGDPTPAVELPWDRPDLLRAHVLPPHLAELAAAAAAGGAPDVEPVLRQIPDVRAHLVRAGETAVAHGPTVGWIRDRVARLPPRPEFDLRIELLGATSLRRGATEVTEAAWVKRERVRELLALVALHRRLSRRRCAELLWPDLPVDSGLENLRVNLFHLQKVLQPERGRAPAWFVRATTDSIELGPTGIDLDVDRFERLAALARERDDSGRPAEAIASYRELAELYRGDLVDDLPGATWAEPDRARLRALATGSLCRLGELLLARGEPEEAATWAARSLRLESLHERAVRLLGGCLEAQGDRAGAARVLRDLVHRLGDEGLTPERPTRDHAARFGVAPP